VIAIWITSVAFGLSTGVFSTIFPVYANERLLLSPSLISLLFSIRGVTNVLIRMPAGMLSDKIGRRKPFLLANFILIVVFILLAYMKNFILLLIVMAFYGLGWGMRVAPSTALLSESVILEDRSLVIALFLTMFDFGSMIGALFTGLTATLFPPSIMMLICVPIMIFTLMIFALITTEVD